MVIGIPKECYRIFNNENSEQIWCSIIEIFEEEKKGDPFCFTLMIFFCVETRSNENLFDSNNYNTLLSLRRVEKSHLKLSACNNNNKIIIPIITTIRIIGVPALLESKMKKTREFTMNLKLLLVPNWNNLVHPESTRMLQATVLQCKNYRWTLILITSFEPNGIRLMASEKCVKEEKRLSKGKVHSTQLYNSVAQF